MSSSATIPRARITPAHAGKTDSFNFADLMLRDHPRACGENSTPGPLMSVSHGSPPRMRGKLTSSGSILLTKRITPAHAGKTLAGIDIEICGSDHPRACGENV